MKKKLMALISALVLCVGLMVPVSAADQTFTDVPATHWAHDAVDYVVNLGLFNGTSATTFSPNTPMTRAMLIQALFRYAGSPQLPDTWVFPFEDVPEYVSTVATYVSEEENVKRNSSRALYGVVLASATTVSPTSSTEFIAERRSV